MSETKTVNAAQKSPKRIRISFGVKLALIVTVILVGSILTINALMSAMVSSEFVRTAEETNFDINRRAASGIRERLYNIRLETLLFLDMIAAPENNASRELYTRTVFFERNPAIAAIIVPGVNENLNGSFLSNNEIAPEALRDWVSRETETAELARHGEPAFRNASPDFGINLLVLFYPWQNRGIEDVAVVFFAPENLSEITGSGSSSTEVVNSRGDILVHPDINQVLMGANIGGNPIFDALQKAEGESVRMSYTQGDNRFVGAGHRISFADTAVFSSLEYSRINEQVIGVSRRNMMLSVTVMFLTILITWFFAKTVTTPIKKLSAAAKSIEAGEFNFELESKSRDELGDLTRQFIAMARGLKRWIETRNLVGRFAAGEIHGKAAQDGLKVSGQYLKAAVLYVDFVSFPETAGPLSASEALLLLNLFIAKTAECLQKNGGVVDKITGQRLSAVWGVPASADPAKDAADCLRAALALRILFGEINTERESRGEPLLRVNCGVHTGELLAGGIGTAGFLEYSVTGKVIEEAARISAECTEAGTDIAISGAARELAGDRFLIETVVLSKSKKDPRTVYGLVNQAAGEHEKQRWPFTLRDVRDFLGINWASEPPARNKRKKKDKSPEE